MTTADEHLNAAIQTVRAEAARRASQPGYRTGIVMSVDKASRVVIVAVDGGTTIPCPVVDDTYVPLVGHRVLLPMNGNEIIGARPPKGPTKSVITMPDGGAGPEFFQDPSFELGVSEFTQGTNTSIVQSGTQFKDGAFSMRMTRNSTTGNAEAFAQFDSNDIEKFKIGRTMHFSAWFRAGTTGRNAQVTAAFFDVNNTQIDGFTSPVVADNNAGWAQAWMSAIVPEGCTKIQIYVQVLSCAATEIHYVDVVSFREAVVDMGASGAKAWLFDTTNEGWGGTWTGNSFLVGPGAIISNAGATTCTSPAGTSGEPVVVGKKYSAFLYVKPKEGNGTERTLTASIRWSNGAGTFLSSNDGPAKLIKNGEYQQLIVNEVTAPATAAFATVRVTITSPGGAQQWYIDTAVLTTPPNARIRTNTNPTYILAGNDTSIEVRSIGGGVCTVQWPYGFAGQIDLDDAGKPTSMIPVVAGDHWRLGMDFINDAANATKRNPIMVASWYDGNGDFVGITINATPIFTNPLTEWNTQIETFQVPEGVSYMRARMAFLCGAGEAIYLNNAITQRVPLSDARIQSRGPVNAQMLDKSGQWVQMTTSGAVWIAGPAFLITDGGLHVPMGIEAVFNGYANADVAYGQTGIRIGLTYDNFQTWDYGQQVFTITDAAYIISAAVSARHSKNDLPVGAVYCWAEVYMLNIATATFSGELTWRTIPI